MDQQASQLWIDDSTEPYPPELYQPHGIAQRVDGFAAITATDIARFHEEGYLVIHNAFTSTEVHTALEALLDLIEGKNPDFKGIQYEAGAKDILHTLPRAKKQDVVRKLWRFVGYNQRLKALSEHPQLIRLLTRIIGEPPELFQDMALFKPPKSGAKNPGTRIMPILTCRWGHWW